MADDDGGHVAGNDEEGSYCGVSVQDGGNYEGSGCGDVGGDDEGSYGDVSGQDSGD
jgi:hypothetical protein